MSRPQPSALAQPLDWEQIRLFLAIMRDGSLAAAARRLALDISTMSRRLDKLEEQIGAVLFDRGRQGTTPTAVAEQMLPFAEEMELSAARFTAASAQVETRVEGVVRLTVMPGIADAFIAPKLVLLQARHPRLVVELDASISYADLSRREADVAIRANPPTSGELVVTRLITARALPMTSPGYAAEVGQLDRFEDARWIAWGEDLAHIPTGRWLREHAPMVQPVLRTSHFSSQVAAARSGLGVVLAAAPFEETGLVAVRHGPSLDAAWRALPEEHLWLVGHKALRRVPRVAAVWDFILEVIGGWSRPRAEPEGG